MNPLLVIGLVGLVVILLEKQQAQILSRLNTSQPIQKPGFTLEAPTGSGALSASGVAMVGSGISIGTDVGTQLAQEAGSTLSSAIPIVGAAVGAIFSSLMAASAKRAAQAKNENQAVVAGVEGWDSGVSQIVSAFNDGQLQETEVYYFLGSPQTVAAGITSSTGVLWKNYWNEVGPQVQPGRNGCQSGTVPHPLGSFCGGSYGAGCCVAYDDLDNGALYICQAVKQAAANPGVPVTSKTIPTVYASKYGGVNRPGYAVTVRKPSSSVTSTSLLGL